jgi:K+-transporting ATPase ATPase C chain
MLSHLRPALILFLLFMVLTGFVYPLAIWGIGQGMFPYQADGSLIEKDGRLIGSGLIGQGFTDERYFHGRPSATAKPYAAAGSSGSNAGPTNKAMLERVKAEVEKRKQENPELPVPVDLVTTSASGIDPHISLAAARFQEKRVAKARGIGETELRALVGKHTRPRFLGLFGEPVVNVLELNLALDEK